MFFCLFFALCLWSRDLVTYFHRECYTVIALAQILYLLRTESVGARGVFSHAHHTGNSVHILDARMHRKANCSQIWNDEFRFWNAECWWTIRRRCWGNDSLIEGGVKRELQGKILHVLECLMWLKESQTRRNNVEENLKSGVELVI